MAAATVDRLAEATRRVLAAADFQSRLAALGYLPWAGNGAELAASAGKERAMWATVTRGIQID
jgi:tripartite-type tricarboxylate transporter receptor subunit TctC